MLGQLDMTQRTNQAGKRRVKERWKLVQQLEEIGICVGVCLRQVVNLQQLIVSCFGGLPMQEVLDS